MVWGILSYSLFSSFRDGPKAQTGNLEIQGSMVRIAPEWRQWTLPYQFLHRAFETFDGDREHALRKQPADQGGGFRIVPVPLRHRVEPHRVRIGANDAIEPDRSGLFVDMLDRAARHHELLRRHRGVADEHHLVVVR